MTGSALRPFWNRYFSFEWRFGFLLLALGCVFRSAAQPSGLKERTLAKFNFREYKIPVENDTIFYYAHKKHGSKPDKVVVYLQGTSPIPGPFFEEERRQKGYAHYQYFPSDYELLDEGYLYVVIGLPGVPAVAGAGKLDLEKYNRLNSLHYRVFAADRVIHHIAETHFEPEKIIVYGHSEGAFVAPKLATVNQKITHLGVWGGSALPDFFDFILCERKANLQGLQSDATTQGNIDQLLEQFRQIANDSLNTVPSGENEFAEYPNKRWHSYAEPTINHLILIDIPIYVQVATEDENSPVESNYLIPLEFARLGKKNLSFHVCVGCDHGFKNATTQKDHWSDIFADFIQWTEED